MSKFTKKASQAKNKQWETWTTSEGKRITVDQMSEEHCRNVLNQLLKKIRLRDERNFKRLLRDELNALGNGLDPEWYK